MPSVRAKVAYPKIKIKSEILTSPIHILIVARREWTTRSCADPPCEEIRPVLTGERYAVRWLSHTRRVLAKEKFTR